VRQHTKHPGESVENMSMIDWIVRHHIILLQMAAAAGLTILVFVLLLRWAFVHMRPDFFTRRKTAQSGGPLRTLLLVGKNVTGAMLMIGGLVLLFLPGPGVIAILIGAVLMNFPGKHRLIVRVLSRPAVSERINRWRCRAGKPRLLIK
jgi:hypothetical protein